MAKLLAGKAAVVTGGSHGLGRAIAGAYLAEGAKVLIVGRNPQTLQIARAHLAPLGHVAVLSCDVTASDAAACIGACADAQLGGWDILVNCAGIFVWKNLLELSEVDWQTSLETNLSAPFRLSQALVRRLVAARQPGSIINVGSIHGILGDGNAVPQCASKAGVLGLTRALAEGCREANIRVNAIAPGAIETDSAGRSSLTTANRVTQGDLAQLAVYLASDQASFVTGTVIEAFGATRPVISNG